MLGKVCYTEATAEAWHNHGKHKGEKLKMNRNRAERPSTVTSYRSSTTCSRFLEFNAESKQKLNWSSPAKIIPARKHHAPHMHSTGTTHSS